MTISREVLCSEKRVITITGTSETPEYDNDKGPEQQETAQPSSYEIVYLAFDETIEQANVPRNSHYMKVTPEEAKNYSVGVKYTLAIA